MDGCLPSVTVDEWALEEELAYVSFEYKNQLIIQKRDGANIYPAKHLRWSFL